MALPQGQADGSLPAGDPSPSEGTPGPSRAPASPAANRRRALLKELEARVQAAYGQVKGTGVRGARGSRGDPPPQPGPCRTDPGESSGRSPGTCRWEAGSVSCPGRRLASLPTSALTEARVQPTAPGAVSLPLFT